MTTRRRGNREGSIFQRGDGRWVGTISIPVRGGGRKRRSVYAKTRRDVVDGLKRLQANIDAGIVPAGDRQTVETYLDRWLTTVPDLRPRTHYRYATLLRVHVIPHVGTKPLAKLTPTDVRGLLTQLRGTKSRIGRPLSAQAIHHVRAVLRRALADAVRDELVVRNAAAGQLVDAPKVNRHEVDALTPDQADAILNAVRDDPLGPLYTLALATGLRQGELLGLRWADVDVEGRWLHVRQTYGRVGKADLFDMPKTDKSRRSVPLIDLAVTALREQRRRQVEARLLAGPEWTDLDLVFAGTFGRPLKQWTVSKRLHDLLGPVGLPRLRFHDLRHGCATLLLRRGVPIPVISRVLGHSTPTTTMNIYAHVAADTLKDEMARLDAVLGS